MIKMSAEGCEEQRQSFARGNAAIGPLFDPVKMAHVSRERFEASECKVRELELALKFYGQHKPRCEYYNPEGCTCGLAALHVTDMHHADLQTGNIATFTRMTEEIRQLKAEVARLKRGIENPLPSD